MEFDVKSYFNDDRWRLINRYKETTPYRLPNTNFTKLVCYIIIIISTTTENKYQLIFSSINIKTFYSLVFIPGIEHHFVWSPDRKLKLVRCSGSVSGWHSGWLYWSIVLRRVSNSLLDHTGGILTCYGFVPDFCACIHRLY